MFMSYTAECSYCYNTCLSVYILPILTYNDEMYFNKERAIEYNVSNAGYECLSVTKKYTLDHKNKQEI